jgi:cell division protein FtsA
MNNENFETFFDCGYSKVRAGVFNQNNKSKSFYAESDFLTDHLNLKLEIQKIIASFEKDTNEYIDNVNLMIDSPKMLSVGVSISKKIDGYKLKLTNVQFLVQEAKQQILKYYKNYNIAHIIINNYKIDDIDYSYLPEEIKCHFISLDIIFICLPSDQVLHLKNIFSQSNVLINQITCSSYVKSIYYKDNLKLTGPISFIDVGFNKTSIVTYFNDTIFFLDTLPIGGNHITRDISKILKLDMKRSEQIKLNFYHNCKILKDDNFSQEKIQNIIFARIEEILKLCNKSIHLNSPILGQFKILLMGEGSKILNNKFKNQISFLNDMVFFDETLEGICQSGLKFSKRLNTQEVVVMPKKQIKEGFFEKLFHFFR